jgi:hypothetical protein
MISLPSSPSTSMGNSSSAVRFLTLCSKSFKGCPLPMGSSSSSWDWHSAVLSVYCSPSIPLSYSCDCPLSCYAQGLYVYLHSARGQAKTEVHPDLHIPQSCTHWYHLSKEVPFSHPQKG